MKKNKSQPKQADPRDELAKSVHTLIKKEFKKLGITNAVFSFSFIDSKYNLLSYFIGDPRDRAQAIVAAHELRRLADSIEDKMNSRLPENIMGELMSKFII
jgi:hypothetical protein